MNKNATIIMVSLLTISMIGIAIYLISKNSYAKGEEAGKTETKTSTTSTGGILGSILPFLGLL